MHWGKLETRSKMCSAVPIVDSPSTILYIRYTIRQIFQWHEITVYIHMALV